MQKVELFINPNEYHSGYFDVVVNGSGFYDHTNRAVGARLLGEDQWFDDYLTGIGIPGLTRINQQGDFGLYNLVHKGVLNEDWEGRDEIYAVVGVDGYKDFKTNTVKRNF